ncbi:uncharacterized protein LOC129583435 [Paramacrobiotus metropolitanus]|uniref:uncharacterized protein LOC129583435 n=1 Tax=Paramacrobiotus metropolitanus TaxID=2943436 RepID=UPI002445DBEF|nr:uncharacterized protein LOC129583435 [Paramacrobiotus metropolitanus]
MMAKILTFCLTVVLVVAEPPNEEPSSSAVTFRNYQTGHPLVGVARVALIPYGEFVTLKCKMGLSVGVHGAWYVMLDAFGSIETASCKHSDIPDKDKMCPESQENEPGLCRLYSRDPSTHPLCKRRGAQIVYSCYDARLRPASFNLEWHKSQEG